MDKYIFLDVDGVLATPESVENGGEWKIVDYKQTLFSRLMREPNDSFDWIKPKIVLSSSWRKWDLETTRQFMKEEGFWFWEDIIGITIRAYQYIDRTKKIHLSIPRGVEIQQWIDTHIHSDNGKYYQRKKLGTDYLFVILDDDTDMLLSQKDYFVNTNGEIGLTIEDVNKANRILRNDYSMTNIK